MSAEPMRVTPSPWFMLNRDTVNARALWKRVLCSVEVTAGNDVATFDIVADATDVASFEKKGNAQLMAAAPELLAFAKDAIADLEAMAVGADPTKWPSLFARIAAGQAAIAKAEDRPCSA